MYTNSDKCSFHIKLCDKYQFICLCIRKSLILLEDDWKNLPSFENQFVYVLTDKPQIDCRLKATFHNLPLPPLQSPIPCTLRFLHAY